MDTLTRYVFFNYSPLMTRHERLAYRNIITQGKMEHSTSEERQRMLRMKWMSSDPEALALLRDGPEQFMLRVRERILRERPGDVFLNHCPRCGALARTPRARQCPRCFLSWHEAP